MEQMRLYYILLKGCAVVIASLIQRTIVYLFINGQYKIFRGTYGAWQQVYHIVAIKDVDQIITKQACELSLNNQGVTYNLS